MNEEIYNIKLIKDNCKHASFELNSKNPSFYRIAKECHHALYRAMIETLKGTANLQITYERKCKRSHTHQYKLGDNPWLEIRKETIIGCKTAWRFSEPKECEEPAIKSRTWDLVTSNQFLINFFEALAMVQTECFMSNYIFSNKIEITDIEMKDLEWLHLTIRNTFEHYIPMTFVIGKTKLQEVSFLSLRLTRELLFESKNTMGRYPTAILLKKIVKLEEDIRNFSFE